MDTYAPPDPYAPHLAKLRAPYEVKLRAASSTPERRFEETYKAARRRELADEYERYLERRCTAAWEAQQRGERVLRTLDGRYAAPNGYQLALDAMQAAS